MSIQTRFLLYSSVNLEFSAVNYTILEMVKKLQTDPAILFYPETASGIYLVGLYIAQIIVGLRTWVLYLFKRRSKSKE